MYNIGGNCEKRNIDVVKMIVQKLGKPEELIRYVKDRPGHDLRYAMDISKMREEFGWEPKVGFEEGIEKTIEWYRSNKEWWMEIINGEYMEYYDRMYSKR